MKKLSVFLIVMLALLLVAGTALAASGGTRLTTSLNGSEEVPGPGDPDGSGFARITLNRGQGRVCWEISYSDIAPAAAAHIHAGPAGVAGPVVVTLNPNVPGCVSADPDLINAIIQSPEQYYVNVHNSEFQPGAIRGQLSKRGHSD